MKLISSKSRLDGIIAIPASKSHTIRGVIVAALAEGESALIGPLDSLDTRSATYAAVSFGASMVENPPGRWVIGGVDGVPRVPENVVDAGNSGTTLYMMMGTAALVDGWTVLTGDGQIRRRTASPLIDALGPLGVQVFSTRDNGMAPIVMRGRMRGGCTRVAGVSSQYLSSLLLACPLAKEDSDITVTVLNERPYVRMTLDWLARQDIHPEADEAMSRFRVRGGNRYRAFERAIPADFSTAAFPLCAGVLAGGTVTLTGLEMDDPQGDKEIVAILGKMGASITQSEKGLTVRGGTLRGMEIDMNAIPDAIPVMAVCACFAEGVTVLHNVPQARIKETDRIAVMASELSKLGADIKELPDGLIVNGGGLRGGTVHGHGDHRVVMALAVAGFAADGPVTVDTAEAAAVTWPGFQESMRRLGGALEERS
jgi:3-phosphoshikimate 1-carboxyvinyltransferase